MSEDKRFDPDFEQDKDEQAPEGYGTSPLNIDEHIGPDQTDSGFEDVQPANSAYGGAEYKGNQRNDTLYHDNPELDHPDIEQDSQHERGVGYSSGAGQQGDGFQGDERRR